MDLSRTSDRLSTAVRVEAPAPRQAVTKVGLSAHTERLFSAAVRPGSGMPPSAAYAALEAEGVVRGDPRQRAALALLDEVCARAAAEGEREAAGAEAQGGLLSGLFGGSFSLPTLEHDDYAQKWRWTRKPRAKGVRRGGGGRGAGSR